jgi:RHS repeat-associated protein
MTTSTSSFSPSLRLALFGIVATAVTLCKPAHVSADTAAAPAPNYRLSRVHSAERLGANPSEDDIATCEVFSGPLVPMGKGTATPAEDAALSTALKKYAARPEPDDFSSLKGFLSRYPHSPWRISLTENLAVELYHAGYYDQALDEWEMVWREGKNVTYPPLRAVVDLGVAHLAQMNSRLGRYDRLIALFAEIKGRKVVGPPAEILLGAKEAMGLMAKHPEESYRCGPLAIESILKAKKLTPATEAIITRYKSTAKGISMDNVKNLADAVGLHYQLAFRSPGAQVIIPAVVHWKVNHYAALLRRRNGRIVGEDSTFMDAISITSKALDAESDGYFLVPAGKLPPGWRAVNIEEASAVWGKGVSTSCLSSATTCHDNTSGGDGSGCNGMPRYQMTSMLVSLKIFDTPISIPQPVGGSLDFKLTYNQREAQLNEGTGTASSGEWTTNWSAYILDSATNPGETVAVSLQNGGSVTYTSGTSTGYPYIYQPQTYDASSLIMTTSTSYELDYVDGSKEIFNVPNGVAGSGRSVFLGKIIDRMGNATILAYNTTNYNLTSITGCTGAHLNLAYVGSYLTSITGTTPAGGGLTANIGYSSAYYIQSITDSIGMSSTFSYIGTFINAMTTPYGTTSFSYGDYLVDASLPSTERWLKATDPAGGTEELEYLDDEQGTINGTGPITGIAGSDNSQTVPDYLPTGGHYIGFDNNNLYDRNSFYWSKKAYMVAPGNFSMAKIMHWLHYTSFSTSGDLESVKMPYENRVWYQYPGQADTIALGTTEIPDLASQVLDTSNWATATQYYQYQYNTQGNLTQYIDPAGRVRNYTYQPNGIDLAGVYQSAVGSSSSDQIASYTFNSQHQPLTITNAAGQTATCTYNTQGQLLTKAVVVSGTTQTTTWNYDSSNHLTSLVGPITSGSNSYTYDSLNRLSTATDPDGRTLTYGYDLLNRPVSITYPDSTENEVIYNRRDVEWKKDRINRWTHLLHDQLGRLTYVIDPAGNTTQYQYCACGALTAIVDPKNNTTSFTLDAQSRLTQKTFADNSSISYTYQPDTSRLQSTTDAKGQVTSYVYNNDNTLASVSYTGSNATPGVSYGYDPVFPRMISMADAVTGTTAFNYNAITGSPVLGANMLGSVVNTGSASYSISYGYDELNRFVGRVVDGGTTSIVYDALGRVTNVANPLGTFSYIPYGGTNMIDHVNYPNGLLVQYAYYPASADGRLETITNEAITSGTSIVSQFGYGYDSAGDIASWSQQAGAAAPLNYQYGYDGADQLLQATASVNGAQSPIDAYAYLYDAAGNRTTEQINASVTTSAYNNLNQVTTGTGGGLLTISGSVSQPSVMTIGGGTPFVTGTTTTSTAFSAQTPVITGSNNIQISATNVNGYGVTQTLSVNVTGGTESLTYDANGNLTNDGTQAYKWDSANRLIEVDEANGGVSRFAYDGLSRRALITETATNGTVMTKNLVWDGMSICEEKNASDVVTKAYYDQGVQLSGSNYYYTRDHLGSIREVTDSNAHVQAEYNYDPYGQQTETSGTMTFDFGFTGQYYHQPSGLLLAPYRGYLPSLGRWISRDPLDNAEIKQGPNLYEYVGNAPVRFVDPNGTDIWIGGPWPHENINVGKPGNCSSYSFGLDAENPVTFSNGLNGVIYNDFRSNDPNGSGSYLNTTPAQDAQANSILNDMVNEQYPYRLSNSSCRSFSNSMFNAFQQMYGQGQAPAPPLPSPRYFGK